MCELLAEDETNMNIDRAQYWIERADKSYPHHPTIFKLKEKLFSVDKTMNGGEDLETLIKGTNNTISNIKAIFRSQYVNMILSIN